MVMNYLNLILRNFKLMTDMIIHLIYTDDLIDDRPASSVSNWTAVTSTQRAFTFMRKEELC